MKTSERGEVATILAISAIVVIGISMISSAFFGGKKQSTSSKAGGTCRAIRGSQTCHYNEYPTEDETGPVCCPNEAPNIIPTAVLLPTEPLGAGVIEPDRNVNNSPATQATTAPTTAPASTDLCGGNNGACKDNCGGSGNDCVKYLESVSVPGLSDGSVITTDSFNCDIVTKNVSGVRTDTDNICGVKVNDQWPAWCPWDGVGQYMCGATITSRANCNLKSSHFTNTPVKAGDKLQVVAARKVGSCGNIPWNTAGSFITGPTFYYKQKGGGGTAPPTQNNPPANTNPPAGQPPVVQKQPAADLGDPNKCPDANNVRTQAIGTKAPPYECCAAYMSLSKVAGAANLEYASWSDNGCKGGATATVPTAGAPTSVPGSTTPCFTPVINCATECAAKSVLDKRAWYCVANNTYCCPNPNAVTPTIVTTSPTTGPTNQPSSITPIPSGAPSSTLVPTSPPTPTYFTSNEDFNKKGSITITVNFSNPDGRKVEDELKYFFCGIASSGPGTQICNFIKSSESSVRATIYDIMRYDTNRTALKYRVTVNYNGRATVSKKELINEEIVFRGDEFTKSLDGQLDFSKIKKNFSVDVRNSRCTRDLIIPAGAIKIMPFNFPFPDKEITIKKGDTKFVGSSGVDSDANIEVHLTSGVCLGEYGNDGTQLFQIVKPTSIIGNNYAFLIDIK